MTTDSVIRVLLKLINVCSTEGFMSKEILLIIKKSLDKSETDEDFEEELYNKIEEIRGNN